MMKNSFFLIFSFLFFCCQHSTDLDDFPENGKTSLRIDNVQFAGEAYLSSRNIDNFNFRSIILDLDDTTSVEILSEDFDEGFFNCDPSQEERCVIFTLKYDRMYKPYYSAKEGILNLKKVSSEQIIGEFNIVVFDVTSSCKDCPGTLKKIEGKFNATKM